MKALALLFAVFFTACTSAAPPPIIWGSPYAKLMTKGVQVSGSDTTTTCAAAVAGSIRYNAGTFQGCDGSNWSSFAAGSGTVTSVSATVPAFLTANGSAITTSGTLAIGLSGTALPLANGGTGNAAASANAAFNALSPMTTGGDIIYGGASGAATRLANGSAGQVLTSAGTTLAPTWTAPAAAAAVGASVVGNSISLSANTWAQVTFASTTFDTSGSIVSGNTFVVPATGKYLVCMDGRITATLVTDKLMSGYSINSGSVGDTMSQATGDPTGSDLMINGNCKIFALTSGDIFRGFFLSNQTVSCTNIAMQIMQF